MAALGGSGSLALPWSEHFSGGPTDDSQWAHNPLGKGLVDSFLLQFLWLSRRGSFLPGATNFRLILLVKRLDLSLFEAPGQRPAEHSACELDSEGFAVDRSYRRGGVSEGTQRKSGTEGWDKDCFGCFSSTLKGEMPGPLPIWRGIMIQASTKSLIAEWLTGWLFA